MADTIVTVATYYSLWEASLAKNALEAEGITASLANELTAAVDAGMINLAVPIPLQVARADADRALLILRQLRDRADEEKREQEPNGG